MKRPFDAYGLRSSLVSRTLVIAALFLGVPLLILVCFLYFDESQIQKKDSQRRLTLFADFSQHSLEQAIGDKQDQLRLIDHFFEESRLTSLSLEKLSQEMRASALFYLQKSADGYVCQYSSEEKLLKQDFNPLVKQGYPLQAMKLAGGEQAFTLFAKSKGELGMWGCIFSLSQLKQLLKFDSHHLDISLLSDSNQVLFSSDPELQDHTLEFAAKEKHLVFESSRIEYSGVIRKVPLANFSLLVSNRFHHGVDDLPYFIIKIVILMGVILFVGMIAALFMISRLVKPMKQLCSVMQGVAEGDLQKRYKSDRVGFEINVLGEIFNETVSSLVKQMKVAEKERGEKGALKRELILGQEVQSSILPRELPTYPGLDIGAHFVSAKEVGGDFYDFLQQNEKLLLSIADTSGKGISACLYSLSLRSMLRSFGRDYSDLDPVIVKSNNLFCADTGDSGIFVTAWIAFFDPNSGELTYSNCGHCPALLQRKNGSWERLSTSGMAMGVLPFEKAEVKRTTLERGDKLFLYTDGIVEAHNASMEMFGEDRLIEVLNGTQELDANSTVQRVVDAVFTFSQGVAQHDDLTAVVIKC